MKKIDVPYHGQKKEYTCGPASLRMVFSYFDSLQDEKKLARQAKTSRRKGTSRKQMVLTARKAGYWVYEQTGAGINVLKWCINHELPAIVNYIEPADDEGHYAVVVGYDPKGVLLHDPYPSNGQNFHLARRTFLARWHGKSEKSERWVMTIGYNDFRPLPYTEDEELLSGTFYDPL